MNLKKEDTSKTRYCVQYDDHSRMMCSVLCSLMEHQSLVDLAIRCGNNTIHAHKCILAANSVYFREQLEKNPSVEQIVINGLDFSIVKSIVEFMYCGETNVNEDNFKYMVAASKLFQIRGIQALAADNHYDTDENIHIPAPLFLSKKPKYSSTYMPVNNLNMPTPNVPEKMNVANDPSFHRRLKRKFMRTEAEKACAKEEAASRLALEALQKELASTDQMSSFVIEESCTETTVENFIPHSEDTFMDNLNHLEGVPLQVVNYADLNNSVLNNPGQIINMGKPVMSNTVLQYDQNSSKNQESAAEKLRQILGSDIPSNVEIMFKTSDGNFVSLTDEVLQNITRESLQYQVIDEHGRAGEVQQLAVNIKDPVDNNIFNQSNTECEHPIAKYLNPIESINDQNQPVLQVTHKFENDISTDQSILESIIESERRESDMKDILITETSIADLSNMDNSLENSLDLDIETKNLQKNKLDSLKKRITGVRRLRTMNVSTDTQFCDDFFNTLTDDEPHIMNTGIMENISPLSQVSDNLLNTIHQIEDKDPNDSGDCRLPNKRMNLNSGNIFSGSNDAFDVGIIEYSPRRTRSNRQSCDGVTPDKDTDAKNIDVDICEKYDIRSRKMVTRKRNK